MTEAIIVAIIGGAFTLVGVLIANARSNAVTNTEIIQLRQEVQRLNGLIERTYRLEERASLHEAELKRHNERLKALEDDV